MSTKTNNKKNKNNKCVNCKRFPPDQRQWIIGNMIAIELDKMPTDLALMFLEFVEDGCKKGFERDLVMCLEEAKKIADVER